VTSEPRFWTRVLTLDRYMNQFIADELARTTPAAKQVRVRAGL